MMEKSHKTTTIAITIFIQLTINMAVLLPIVMFLFRPYCSNDGEEIFCSSRSVLKLMLLHGKIVKHQILIFAGYLAGRISSYFAG